MFVIGMAAATLPVGVLIQRYGRLTASLLGSLCGVVMGLVAAFAIGSHSIYFVWP